MKHRHDFLLAQELINAGLLTEINAAEIQASAPEGAVLITCGDRDRVTGLLSGCQRIIPVHVLSLNGGALLLSDGIDATRQQVLLEECVEAMFLKNLRFVFNLSHFPCGKGEALGIDLRNNILANLNGKSLLKKVFRQYEFPKKPKVLPIISIDWRSAPGNMQADVIKLYATSLAHWHAIANFSIPSSHDV